MTIETVKGFRDYSGKEAWNRKKTEKTIVETFESYGFEPAETPIIEREEFVKGENANDEAVSDIFKLNDKGDRKLALRYEFTFQLRRLAKNKKLPYKRFQIGPVFRDEPVSSNRIRQFTQCDVDTVGSTIKEEAEILSLTNEVFEKLGIKPMILVNNRKLLNEILDDNNVDKKNRERVLKEIDKYDKLPEKEVKKNLERFKAAKIIDLLKKGEKYFSKFQGYKEIKSLIECCKLFGLKILFSPTVVRGLSYYNGNVFEIKTQGIKETIAGGGSYLIDQTQATGISFGLERISSLVKDVVGKEKTLVISLEKDKEAIKLTQKIRERGEIVSIYYGKPSKALDYANSYEFEKVVFVGEKEVKAKKFMIKDMKTGKESVLKI